MARKTKNYLVSISLVYPCAHGVDSYSDLCWRTFPITYGSILKTSRRRGRQQHVIQAGVLFPPPPLTALWTIHKYTCYLCLTFLWLPQSGLWSGLSGESLRANLRLSMIQWYFHGSLDVVNVCRTEPVYSLPVLNLSSLAFITSIITFYKS